jgi:hypothetical protein
MREKEGEWEREREKERGKEIKYIVYFIFWESQALCLMNSFQILGFDVVDGHGGVGGRAVHHENGANHREDVHICQWRRRLCFVLEMRSEKVPSIKI